MGIYDRKLLKKTGIPEVRTRAEAVYFEVRWVEDYILAAGEISVFFSDLNDSDIFEEVFGRTNMVLENDYLKKYKGTWSRSQLDDSRDGSYPDLPKRSKKERERLRQIIGDAKFIIQ